jgi:hypothetical protein
MPEAHIQGLATALPEADERVGFLILEIHALGGLRVLLRETTLKARPFLADDRLEHPQFS